MDKKLTKNMIRYHGEDIEATVCMEECAELIQAISKMKRGENEINNLVEEMADVYICLEMLKLIYDVTDEQIEREIKYKEIRNRIRLEILSESEKGCC